MRARLRYSLRLLRRTPALLLILGAAGVVSSAVVALLWGVIDTLIVRPVGFADASRLVVLRGATGLGPELVSPGAFVALGEGTHTLDGVAAIETSRYSRFVRFTLQTPGGPVEARGAAVSANAFNLVGTPPLLGRTLQPSDGIELRPSAVVLSESLWRRYFDAGVSPVGRRIRLTAFDDRDYEVVGVMPAGFRFLYRSADAAQARFGSVDEQLWIPLSDSRIPRSDWSQSWAEVIARVRHGVDLRTAQQDCAATLHAAAPAAAPVVPMLIPVVAAAAAPFRPDVAVLSAAALCACLSALGCVAGLLLLHRIQRTADLRTMSLLGAPATEGTALLLVTALIPMLVGGTIGVALAAALAKIAPATLPAIVLQGRQIGFEWTWVAAGLSSAVAIGLLAVAIAGAGTTSASAADTPGRVSTSQRGLQQAIAGMQIATALALAAGACLLILSTHRLFGGALGFDADRVFTARAVLAKQQYPSEEARRLAVAGLLQRMEALPGVGVIGVTSSLPLKGTDVRGILHLENDARPILASIRAVSPKYFAALRTPLLRGRYFDSRDSASSQPVAIVSASFSRAYLGGEAEGRTLSFKSADERRAIIGVVSDIKDAGLRTDAKPTVYLPYDQWPLVDVTLVTRPDGRGRVDAAAIAAQLNPDVPWSIESLRDVVASHGTRETLLASLFLGEACMAILIAMLGVYGNSVRLVQGMKKELAIRGALGATATQLTHLVVRRQAGVFVISGLAGSVLSLLVFSAIRSMLFGTEEPQAWRALALAAAMVIAIASAAIWLPARAMAKMSIATGLREG